MDLRDAEILEHRALMRMETTTPQVGDFVVFPDGQQARIAHDWDELGFQPDVRGGGSYYLRESGQGSMSGALDPMLDKEKLVDTGETRMGRFWFFHHDYARAHNGVDVEAPCRVWLYKEDA